MADVVANTDTGKVLVSWITSGHLLMANFLFALALVVFVVFFCLRSASSTKTSVLIMLASMTVFPVFFPAMVQDLAEGLMRILSTSVPGKIGILCCAVSVAMLLAGFSDEEKSEEYVHGRLYWTGAVLCGYCGLFFTSVGMIG